MRGYFEKVKRPVIKLKGYGAFFKQKDMCHKLDNKEIQRWSDERLDEEYRKIKRRIKVVNEFKKGPVKLASIMYWLSVFAILATAIIKRQILIQLLVVQVLFFIMQEIISWKYIKADNILQKNAEKIKINKNRRIIRSGKFEQVEAIDSPELCAILAKATLELRIDEIRSEKGPYYYNVYVNGRRYKLKQDVKLEESIITD